MVGLDAQPAAFDHAEQRVLVAREPKEPVALGHLLGRLAVLATASVDEILSRDERLATGAVEALVIALVKVARLCACAPQALDAGAVARVGARANEVVGRELKRFGELCEPLRLLGHELGHGCAGRDRSIDILQRVVVGAAEEANVVAAESAMPREHVRLHELQRVPEVRIAVDVRDRGCDVEPSRVAHRVSPFWPRGASVRSAIRAPLPMGPV